MKKYLKWSLIMFLVLIVCFLLFRFWFMNHFFSLGDSKDESRVLIDSLKLNDNETLYWFKYGDLTGNTSVSYMSIERQLCSISIKNAIIKGDLIYRIDTIRNDSIFIISRLGFEIINAHPKYKVIDKIFSYDEHYKDKGLEKEVFLNDICK